jgi:hypothetical protein
MTVAKLKGARDRKRRNEGKCEGRKSYAEGDPNMVRLAKTIKGRNGQVSPRDVAKELAAHRSPEDAALGRRSCDGRDTARHNEG